MSSPKRIGIIIGVSAYSNPELDNLPGCLNDIRLMKVLLSEKCDYVFEQMQSEVSSSSVLKTALVNFVNEHKNLEIEEVTFYFTGHGHFDGNEYYCLLSEYSKHEMESHSLKNSFIDNLLRELGGNLTVKIVDACNSGVKHIKGEEERQIKAYFNQRKDFNKCFFAYSSHNNQSSYQDGNVSDFTFSIINSILKEGIGTQIRYLGIEESVSDSFKGSMHQIPYFVSQGASLEMFGAISSNIFKQLNLILDEFSRNSEVEDGLPSKNEEKEIKRAIILDVIESIKANSKNYCSYDDSNSCLVLIFEKLTELLESTTFDLGEIFEFQTEKNLGSKSIQETYGIQCSSIGSHLSNSDVNYFAEIITEVKTRSKRVPISQKQNPYTHAMRGVLGVGFDSLYHAQKLLGIEYESVTEEYDDIVDARPNFEMPYDHIVIVGKSKYLNVEDIYCILRPFVSQTKISVFFCCFNYTKTSWDKRKLDSSTGWKIFEDYINKLLIDESSIPKLLEQILDYFMTFFTGQLKKKFLKQAPQASSS